MPDRRKAGVIVVGGDATIQSAAEARSDPSWIYTPPTTKPEPPVETRVQQVSFVGMSWEDFQRLIVRLAATEADVEHCQEYGVRGQKQHGIDVYGRRRDRSYGVYQCRRLEDFGPGDVIGAVGDFRKGTWARRAGVFVIATTADTRDTKIAEELEVQAALLRTEGVRLELWGLEQLSTRLKVLPEVVDDFFGRTWVARLCGEDAARDLGERLSHDEVVEYRARLRELYRSVFRYNDPGIPAQHSAKLGAAPLEDRFVALDVLAEQRLIREVRHAQPLAEGGRADDVTQTPQVMGVDRATLVNRRDLDGWLASTDRSVIVAEAGAGKSTTLRFIALDLLSDAPHLAKVAARWAGRLPVWLPFGFWTRSLTTSPATSLSECLRLWLAQLGQSQLWPLVERALRDRRLLLLVDGLDEWTSEDAARIGRDLLQVFVDTQQPAVVVSSRPYGYVRVKIVGEGWQFGRLAPLSEDQQREIATKWFTLRARAERDAAELSPEEKSRLESEVERFLAELRSLPELNELASVPLMLMLLLYLRFQRVALPRGRFQVYSALVDHLVRVHPRARRSAALVISSDDVLSDAELRGAIAALAFLIQLDWPEGVIHEDDLRGLGARALGLSGVDVQEVRRYADHFIDLIRGRLGLLITEGSQVFFLHRAIQEYLAAEHASSLPLDELRHLLRTHVGEPRWRDVVRAALSMVRRPEELADLVRSFDPVPAEDELAVAELRAEVAFGEFRCPATFAASLAAETFDRVISHPLLPHRERLLTHVFTGLRTARSREVVRDRLRRWAVALKGWRPGTYQALRKWPATDETVAMLWDAMHDEDESVAIESTRTLAAVAAARSDVGDRLRRAARSGLSPRIRATSLLALTLGWPGEETIALARKARRSVDPSVRTAAIAVLVRSGQHTEEDLDSLLSMSVGYSRTGWPSMIAPLLNQGWSGNQRLREIAAEAVNSPHRDQDKMDAGVAWEVLLSAFAQDDGVAEIIANEFKKEHPFLGTMLDRGVYDDIARSFRGHPVVIAAAEEWAQREKFHEVQLSRLSPLGPSPVLKEVLLRQLGSSSFPHWPAHALLEVWGMGDKDVAGALRSMALGDSARASRIGDSIPRILIDSGDEARDRLLDLLRAQPLLRPDFLLRALSDLARDSRVDDEVVALGLSGVQANASFSGLYELIQGWPKDRRVRELSLGQLSADDPPISAIAYAYSDDEDMRRRVVAMLTPLPKQLRQNIIEILGRTDTDADLALEVLGRYRQEDDDEVATLGSVAYHSRIRGDADAVEKAVERLRKDVHATGPHHDATRQAAVAGLITLGRLDELSAVIAKDASLMRWLIKPWDPNLPLHRAIADHWEELATALGGDPLVKLSDSAGAWEALAVVGNGSPVVRDVVLRRVEGGHISVNPETLEFVASIRPRSELLLELCLTAMGAGPTDNPYRAGQLAAAVRVFVQQFGESADARARLSDTRARGDLGLWNEGPVLALCLAWPDDPLLDQLYEELQSGVNASATVAFAVLFSRLPATEIAERLGRYLRRGALERDLLPALHTAVSARLARDPAARAALVSALRLEANPDVKASVPRLLVESAEMSDELREWLRDELRRQATAPDGSDLGVDLSANAINVVQVSLQDVLDARR